MSMTIKRYKAVFAPQQQKVLEEWHNVRDAMHEYGDQVVSRWTKKTAIQQRAILQDCGVGLPDKRFPDWKIIRQGLPSLPVSPEVRNIFLAPDFNITELCRPGMLPALLQDRSHFHPAEFANSDLKLVRRGLENDVLVPITVNKVTVFFNSSDPDRCGEIVRWAVDPAAESKIEEGLGFAPGKALLLSEIQAFKYSSLCAIIKAIMHDKPSSLDDELESVSTGTLHPLPVSLLPVRALARATSSLDWGVLLRLASTRKMSTERVIRDAYENPEIFFSLVSDNAEHSLYAILDRYRNQSTVWNTSDFWSTMVCKTLADLFIDCYHWKVISITLATLQALVTRQDFSITSDAYVRAVMLYKLQLQALMNTLQERLMEKSSSSPEFRIYYYRPDELVVVKGVIYEFDKEKDYTRQLFQYAYTPGNDLIPAHFIEELQDVMENVVEKKRISQNILGVTSDIGLVSLLEEEMELIPWFSSAQYHTDKNVVELTAVWNKREAILKLLDALGTGSGVCVVNPNKNFSSSVFEYPDMVSKKTAETRMTSEANLDKILKCFDLFFTETLEITPQSMFLSKFADQSPITRTTAWIDPIVPSSAPQVNPPLVQPLDTSTSIPHGGGESARREAFPTPRARERTTGIADPARAFPAIEDLQVVPEEVKIPVSAESYETFSLFFFVPGQRGGQGRATFNEFQAAMADAGFFEHHQRGGLRHMYFPNPAYGQVGGVEVHEPHGRDAHRFLPDLARNIGREMTGEWGWDLSNFSIRE